MDAWVASERVEVSGQTLSLRAAGALSLEPASYFRKVSAGGDQGLVGKVKSEQAIAALGGETYMTSVILGESAYEVEPGFLATPAPGTATGAVLFALRALSG
jgi:hypothetical protein